MSTADFSTFFAILSLLTWAGTILAVGVVALDRFRPSARSAGRWYALPQVAVGAIIAAYHTQLQAFPAHSSPFCSTTEPCTTRWSSVVRGRGRTRPGAWWTPRPC